MTDLTEYVDAAARALAAACRVDYGPPWEAMAPDDRGAYRNHVTPLVAAVAPLIERDARAAALEDASAQCEADASDWYGTDIFADIDDGDIVAIRAAMQGRGKDIDNVSAHMFRRALKARAHILRDRAQDIREDR